MVDSKPLSKNIVLFITILPSFLVPFMGSSVNIALPSIGREFAMSAVLLSWVPMAYLLVIAMLLVPFGRIADIYGRRRIFLYGLSVYTFSGLLTALSPSAYWLILFRALQAVGGSMIFGTAIAILTSVFPPGERGKALGVNVAATYSGLSLGPFLGGLMTEYLGWRSIFWANVPLGCLVILFVHSKLNREWADARGERFDFRGAVAYSGTLLSLIYGLSLLPAWTGAVLILIGLLGLVAFIRYESKVDSPIFHITLFRNNRTFAFSSLATLIHYSATFAITFLLSLYLQYTKGFSPKEAGVIMVSQPLMQAIFSPFAGRLSDRMEPQMVASAGMAITTLGLIVLSFLTEGTPIPYIIATLLFLGFGFALFSSPNTNAVMSSVDRKFYGLASGTVGTMRSTGMMLSMGMVMLIFVMMMGRTKIDPGQYPLFLKSATLVFRLSAFICLAGVFASLARGKIRGDVAR